MEDVYYFRKKVKLKRCLVKVFNFLGGNIKCFIYWWFKIVRI